MKVKTKCIKPLLSIVLALCMVFGVCPFSSLIGSITTSAAARQGTPAVTVGYWEYYSDGEIYFTGDIKALTDADATPWIDADGADISDNITVITLANTVKKIGANGFKQIKTTVIGIPKTVTEIDSGAFNGSQIKEIYFEGTQQEWKALFQATALGLNIHYGHKHTGEVLKHAVDATCTQQGYEGDKYCALCGAFYAKGGATEKVDHVWSDGYAYIDGREPTCSKPGEQAILRQLRYV